ncbi:MAG: hypothetical protein LIP23_08765, partial [Planctomycetes bacterium]|nr:hypothetical protein [Planctomycetota bacterium]
LERQLVFIVADKPEPEEPGHPCYFCRVEVFVEETGDDDNDDGGVDKPLRSIAGVFEFLKRNYFGITLNLVVNLGRGHFDAPRAWITPDFPCLVQSLHVYGKNGEDQNLTSTTVGDKGVEVYEYVRHIQFFNVSFRCSDEFNSVLYFPVNHCRISIRGWSECINQGSKSIDGITVLGHSYLMLGTDSGGDRIAFTGTFRKVIYVSSHSVANIPASPFFQGTSQFIIDATGMSSVHIYGSDPTFVGNFSGDIRALVGSTIGLSVTDPQRWLPTGANWIKDDISRITGQ